MKGKALLLIPRPKTKFENKLFNSSFSQTNQPGIENLENNRRGFADFNLESL